MGVLQGPDGRRVELLPRMLVGRSPACDLVLDDRSVSGEHAVFVWGEHGWQLRDLNSRNGTSVEGQPVQALVTLTVGARIAFGTSGDLWILAEAAAPAPRAVALDDQTVVVACGDLLGLPDPLAPEVTVLRSAAGGWIVEDDEGSRPVADRAAIVAGGRRWELRLPVLLAPTVDRAGEFGDIVLEFSVSADEEHASWAVESETRRVDLGARVHTYLLLTLARARQEDAAAGLEPLARGWRYADELARRLGITPEVLKVYVYRARRQLQEAGIVGAPALIERRATSNQIRLGTDGIRILRG
jgi:pSer/pThr/pTyr-binding forkhead associated (FHA) protein